MSFYFFDDKFLGGGGGLLGGRGLFALATCLRWALGVELAFRCRMDDITLLDGSTLGEHDLLYYLIELLLGCEVVVVRESRSGLEFVCDVRVQERVRSHLL